MKDSFLCNEPLIKDLIFVDICQYLMIFCWGPQFYRSTAVLFIFQKLDAASDLYSTRNKIWNSTTFCFIWQETSALWPLKMLGLIKVLPMSKMHAGLRGTRLWITCKKNLELRLQNWEPKTTTIGQTNSGHVFSRASEAWLKFYGPLTAESISLHSLSDGVN